MISAILSDDTIYRSAEECAHRVKQMRDPTIPGGILPQLWEWPFSEIRIRRRRRRIRGIPFTEEEHMELFMWIHYRQGLDPLAFNDERCAEELRMEFMAIDTVEPRLLQVVVQYWKRKRIEEYRRQNATAGQTASVR